MPYSPPSSAFTAVDVPLFRRPTPGDNSASVSTHQSKRHTRTHSANMLNFSDERGPGAHKPLRGLPRRAKPSPAPVLTDPSSAMAATASATTADASTPRSMAAFGPPTIPRSSRSRPKFSVGDDDSSESNSASPKDSPSAENGPRQASTDQWSSASTAPKGLSIDTSSVYKEETPSVTVPFPLLSPEPATAEPPTRRAAILPLGSFAQFTSSFANGIQNDDMPTPVPRSLSSSMLPASPSPSPVPALLSPRLLPVGAQKNLSLNGSSHGRSASMADAGLDRSRSSPPASGATTPVIRKSNGQPLKPSLKSSLSSPNISSMNEPRRIAKSAPTTPRVHFKELGLESVRTFDKGARPITVSGEYNGADDTETETEPENGKGYPFPQVSSTQAFVRLAPTTSQLAFQPPPQSYVHLQYLSLPAIRPPRLHGTILVRNVAFGKTIVVRYTTDNWETASEINASYSSSLPPGIVPGSIDASWDKFTFTIKLDDIERSLPDRTLFCVVKYDAHGVGEWWDNNQGQNYRVEFERPESNGLGLTNPSKSGDQSSAPRSFNPLTYQTSSPTPPPPTTKPRSYSTSVVAPPPPIKAPPAPLSTGPQPHLLGLRLSNYVSPSANVPKIPALPKPAEKKEEPREVDSFSPPSSPEHVKRPLELPESDFGVDFHSEVYTPLAEPLKMPVTITPPDSAHNSPSSSPTMKRQPLLPPPSLPQSNDNGLLSPSSSPSQSLLITSPSSPSKAGANQAEQPTEDAAEEQNSPSSPPCFLDQAYSELVSRVCFHHSSPGGTPPYGLGVVTLSPKGGSPVGSGASSPATTSKNGLPRGGSYVLGTTPTFIK
ncbi:Carbohydrate/starch-binding module (family 21) [Rhizoctonia solani]|uniref:Carbohydrate/starch-binding module (Family 21) n=1 Tax=Rhizoctonia solani TaxID=456999 RepID=A0A8H7HHL9_9AGAM|nr:Carbohydrate/starch-binding module (family 21) [Rhizoctonia solani]